MRERIGFNDRSSNPFFMFAGPLRCLVFWDCCPGLSKRRMSRRRKPGSKGLDVIQRLQQRVSEGEFYEALQLYKTSYSRLKAQGKLDNAEELLTAGAIAMSRENEVGER